MKKLVIYYSVSGNTQKEAQNIAKQNNADIVEVKEKKRRSKINLYLIGCPQAMGHRKTEIEPLGVDLNDYDEIVIGAPIWAGFPAPAFNSTVEQLPPGKNVSLFFTMGGKASTKCEVVTKQAVTNKGCTINSYQQIQC